MKVLRWAPATERRPAAMAMPIAAVRSSSGKRSCEGAAPMELRRIQTGEGRVSAATAAPSRSASRTWPRRPIGGRTSSQRSPGAATSPRCRRCRGSASPPPSAVPAPTSRSSAPPSSATPSPGCPAATPRPRPADAPGRRYVVSAWARRTNSRPRTRNVPTRGAARRVRRIRRQAPHRVRDRHPVRAARSPRRPTPRARPGRGLDPLREGHRAAGSGPAVRRVRAECGRPRDRSGC